MVDTDKASAILDEFRAQGRSSAAELYLPSHVIPPLLARCEAEGVLVLGLEGFEVRGSKIAPRLDMIADFSSVLSDGPAGWADKVAESCRLARAFLDAAIARRADILVSAVLTAEPEKQDEARY